MKTKILSSVVVSCCLVALTSAAAEPAAKLVLGYQLDVSRMKVPTMETVYRIVDLLAKLGYNQFQLYTEHTFAYSKHETVWREASPMTPDEIRALDAYCAARGIELVPNQNSFGHFEQWLRHPEYNGLAELPQGGARVPQWGNHIVEQPTSLCPTDPRSIELVAGLYDELLPCFRSKYVNVGCDETVELMDPAAPGRSHDAIVEKGATRVYLDYLIKVHDLVSARGHEMMFWGDIMLYHPEYLTELPKDVIALNWGYEAKHPFERETAAFEKAGRRFIVCPGTSGWGSLFGRVTNMLGNIDNAVAAGSRHGALGYLLADWGDGGYPEPWIVAVPALVYLRDRVQGRRPTREELVAEIDGLLGCTCGAALLAYGDVYLKAGGRQGNTSELFYLLCNGSRYVRAKGSTAETVSAAVSAARAAGKLFVSDGASAWVRDDFALLDLLTRAVELRNRESAKPNFRAIFEPEYRGLWLRQNRLGGLKDSLNLVFGP